MNQRALRNEIFKILFEYELVGSNVEERIEEFLKEHEIVESKKEFFEKYILEYIENEAEVIKKVKEKLKGWTFERLGVVERVLLKMSFFEIVIKDQGHEIVINEAVELSKVYGDEKTKKFINGILAHLIN